MPDSSWWSKVCPPLYQDTDPKRLPQGPLAKVMAWSGPKGLLLHGETGTGKTRAVWLRLRLANERGARFLALDSAGFQEGLYAKFSEGMGDMKCWLGYLSKLPLLFIDDLDKAVFKEWVASELFAVLDRRARAKLPTIITTNATGPTLAKLLGRWGIPFVRRLREYYETVSFGAARPA